MEFSQWRPHPWHGLDVGQHPPRLVNAFVEMTQYDPMKYEIDKLTGYLRLDRPQVGSSLPPCSYGFIPRTYCAERVAALSPGAIRGDGDPLDVCIVSEQPINRAEIVLSVKVVGGFRMLDRQEADDKIVGVLAKDAIWSEADDIDSLPKALIARIQHYLATYKLIAGKSNQNEVQMKEILHASEAQEVVAAAMADYQDHLKRQEY